MDLKDLKAKCSDCSHRSAKALRWVGARLRFWTQSEEGSLAGAGERGAGSLPRGRVEICSKSTREPRESV